ncbi:MAG: PHB depolymerase family esterase [Haliscomenobacter sp.]|uniref:alpha/beta hydrolase family esterase n=1 Tax=Haliscomenobacter sp. TaxID=2717303 RepID=UPI0029A2DD62|nr:dienelactone hydrolase family protein [Haliscomenobacter sp.]MDX2071400.1 PHB depolymerase family esterase [Haliscomenobacter sp.]
MKKNWKITSKLLSLFCALCLFNACDNEELVDPGGNELTAQKRIDHTLNVDGRDREFIVFQPAGIQVSSPVPVVFMLHGTSGNGEKFYNISGWKEKAAKEKFYAIFPSSLSYCITEDGVKSTTTKWNHFDLDSIACPGQKLYDDVKFFREMLKFLQTKYPIDPKRVYVSGFSNGGQFTFRLAVEASDVIAAVAPFGTIFTNQNKVPLSLIPIYHGFGNLDDRFFPLNNGQPLPMGAALMNLGGMKLSTSTICNAFGLTYANTLKETANAAFWTFNTPTKGNTNVYYIHEFKDMTHEYPNGDNYPIAATELLWPFFSKYSK